MRTLRTLFLTCLSLAVSFGVASAQGVSNYMPYQGFLADTTGTPVDGTYNLTFKLYETSDSPDSLWEETIPNVSVAGGAFAVSLGQLSPNMKDYMVDGRAQYLSVAVNGESVSPRQRIGSQAYAFLAYNATQLGGYPPSYFATLEQLNELTVQAGAGLTEPQVNALIDLRGYLNTDAVNALIDARNYLNTAAVNALIDARNYLNTAAVNALIDARNYLSETAITDLVNALIDARNYLNTDAVNALIDGRNYVTENDVNTLIDNRGYVTTAEVQTLINAAVATATNNFTTQITNLQNQITNLENDVTNLETTVNNVGAGQAEILGVSASTTSGKVNFNGQQGIRGANELCRTTFSNVDTAHLCSSDEVFRALAAGNFNAAIDDVQVWAAASHIENDAQTCQNFLYNSGDVSVGAFMTIDVNHTSNGGGGGATGPVIAYNTGVGCGNARPVMCCR